MLLNALGLAILLAQKPTEAEAALRRSLERKSSVNVDAVVEKPFRRGDTIRIRMQVDASGRRRTEVLYPIAVQGRVFVDDGATWTTYNPDTKVLKVHPAPPEEDLDARMELIRRNYRVEIEGRTTIAGRAALRIVATPKAPDLRTQRFYLDAATSIPLKADSIDGLGNVSVQFTVRRIGYPSRFDKATFVAPDAAGARRETGHAPVPLRPGDDVGFRPATPRRKLPYGFRIQSVDRMDRDGHQPVAVKLGDGLVRVYVFQSRVGDGPPHGDDATVSQDVNGVHIEVRGDDVPAGARARILDAYVRWLQHGPRY